MSEEGRLLIVITQRTGWSDPGAISQGGSGVTNLGAGNGIWGYALGICHAFFQLVPLFAALLSDVHEASRSSLAPSFVM